MATKKRHAPAVPQGTPIYVCTAPVHHNGDLYQVGDEIALDAAEAQALAAYLQPAAAPQTTQPE